VTKQESLKDIQKKDFSKVYPPDSKKIIRYITSTLSLLAVLTVGQMSKANAASMTFSVTGTNSVSKNALAASVVFDNSLNPGKLTISLSNNKGVSVPSDVLTAVLWDYNGSPLNLGLSSATASKVTANNGSSTTNNVDLLGCLDEWQFASTSKTAGFTTGVNQHYGLGTAGLGIFASNGGQQFNYGIIGGYNSNANPAVKGGTFINNSATFVLSSLPTNFDIQKISNVRFQYGTSLTEPSIVQAQGSYYTPPSPPKKVPESSTAAALGLFALVGLGLKKKVAVALR
jgi:hypothetical protein